MKVLDFGLAKAAASVGDARVELEEAIRAGITWQVARRYLYHHNFARDPAFGGLVLLQNWIDRFWR